MSVIISAMALTPISQGVAGFGNGRYPILREDEARGEL